MNYQKLLMYEYHVLPLANGSQTFPTDILQKES